MMIYDCQQHRVSNQTYDCRIDRSISKVSFLSIRGVFRDRKLIVSPLLAFCLTAADYQLNWWWWLVK